MTKRDTFIEKDLFMNILMNLEDWDGTVPMPVVSVLYVISTYQSQWLQVLPSGPPPKFKAGRVEFGVMSSYAYDSL